MTPAATTSSVPGDPPGGVSTSSASTSSEGGVDSSAFLERPDYGYPDRQCSVAAQDCPAGEKCTIYANDGGGRWNALGCFPIDPEPDRVGEPCTVQEHRASGRDSCELHAVCWHVDPDTLTGICRSFCDGEVGAGQHCADPGTTCVHGEPLGLCLPSCDPVRQDCPTGEGCYPLNAYVFACAPVDEQASPPGGPCDFINGCEPGAPQWVNVGFCGVAQ